MRAVGIVGVVCAVVALMAGCAGEAEEAERLRASATVGATTVDGTPEIAEEPAATRAPQPRPAPPAPAPAPQPPASPVLGTAIIETVTLGGVAVPDVPVSVWQMRPCDMAQLDIPLGASEIARWDAVTGADGRAVFVVPVGCFRFRMDPPPGTDPVPEGMHTLFVTAAGQVVTGQLRFNDPAPADCAAETIVGELDDAGDLTAEGATVTECDGSWAVIVWDVPGDSQRIVHRTADGWRTYVVFPHDVCWSTAAADGVPARFESYFQPC
ncbi:hypothetical protein APR11_005876 [Nocardia amikacinitolerans]|uniref:hypothetical protein n=1 Tax=Nocardia amikacinitolerans TaxID=756689 RepID=UPI0020A55762|nr:hypothetical protein [Nocardia amikacinitolerans]MCP2299421.1 hypothetical protein [Nocardia amikacinitolerans]